MSDKLVKEMMSTHNALFDGGREYERERIIKLLEDEKFILPEGIDEGLTLMPIQDAIALIKGEK